jgi:adenine-specific DNA-methyltransferase
VRYLGSKASTLPALERIMADRVSVPGTLCDPFGGIGVVGAHFRSRGWRVHSCDLLHCAHYFQVARLMLDAPPFPRTLQEISGTRSPDDFVNYLNSLPPIKSWVYSEFAIHRQFFTPTNAMSIDAVRQALAQLRTSGVLGDIGNAYYHACLIDAMDRVANTAGTYYAHLKHWSRKSVKPFSVRLIQPVTGPRGQSRVGCASELVRERYWDVLYLDPPYNDRDYAAYYHLPETVATGRVPQPQGKSGVDAALRPTSAFAAPRHAIDAMRELLSTARFRLLILHYSEHGLIPIDWLNKELARYGAVKEHAIEALGYSNKGSRRVQHTLYVVSS